MVFVYVRFALPFDIQAVGEWEGKWKGELWYLETSALSLALALLEEIVCDVFVCPGP